MHLSVINNQVYERWRLLEYRMKQRVLQFNNIRLIQFILNWLCFGWAFFAWWTFDTDFPLFTDQIMILFFNFILGYTFIKNCMKEKMTIATILDISSFSLRRFVYCIAVLYASNVFVNLVQHTDSLCACNERERNLLLRWI